MADSDRRPVVALLVPGLSVGGGVPRVARYFQELFTSQGWDCRIIELATSRRDANSQRLTRPSTWFEKPRVQIAASGRDGFAGSHFVEVEVLRYLQSSALRRELEHFDFVTVVAGTPAWANAVAGVGRPTILQVATTTGWERESRDREGKWWARPYRTNMTKIVNRLDRRGIQVPDLILVENPAMATWVSANMRSSATVELVPPAIDTRIFAPAATGWERTGPLISVGRLAEKRKGWERLIRAYESSVAVDKSLPDLVLAGRGALSPGLQAAISNSSSRERIHVHRNPTDMELVELLRRASVFVATPFEEGLGLAALEGMACGLPAVVTETEGSKQYVTPGKTGYLLPQQTPTLTTQFRSAVRRVLDDQGEMSIAARREIEMHYSPGVIDQRVTSLVDATVARGQAARLEGLS